MISTNHEIEQFKTVQWHRRKHILMPCTVSKYYRKFFIVYFPGQDNIGYVHKLLSDNFNTTQ